MSSRFITTEGYALLQQELTHLWRTLRPEVTRTVAWAASLGDRSENADYQYNKKKLRDIDRRILYLRKILPQLEPVSYHSEQEGRVFFGAWVQLSHSCNPLLQCRIVGVDEIYQQKDYISIASPLAKACLGKAVDDEVRVDTPKGQQIWFIEAISYQPLT